MLVLVIKVYRTDNFGSALALGYGEIVASLGDLKTLLRGMRSSLQGLLGRNDLARPFSAVVITPAQSSGSADTGRR
jgi:hypothetical protein